MKIKVSEATPLQLNWLVAKAEGYSGWDGECFTRYSDNYPGAFFLKDYHPSTNWLRGGPIIEQEALHLYPYGKDWYASEVSLLDSSDGFGPYVYQGNTPLIAAMRCYVASKLGDEVKVPKELL